MHFKKVIIPLPKDFSFDFSEGRGIIGDESVLHFHDCLEINYIESGNGVNIIENKRFKLEPGDFYIINNLERHYAYTNGNLRIKVISFDPKFIWQNSIFDYDYIKPFYNRGIHFSNRIGKENPLSGELLRIVKEIEYEWVNKQEGYKMIIKALLMKLLALFYRHFKTSDEIGKDIKSFHKSYDRIRDVVEYINDNYNKDLALEDLAKIALMNKSYLSTYFKKVMSMTISDYIEIMRINMACNQLKTSNFNIAEISSSVGFNNVSHFNKIFKKVMNMTPTQYRKN